MMKFTKKDGWWKLAEILSDDMEFTNGSGSFRGEICSGWVPHTGRMHPQEYNEFRFDSTTGEGITYVVWSYQTPVAWRRSDGTWHVTERSYSQTTKQHLNQLRTAVAAQEAKP